MEKENSKNEKKTTTLDLMFKNTFVSSVPDVFSYRKPCLIHSLAVSPSPGGLCAASVHENTKHLVISSISKQTGTRPQDSFFFLTTHELSQANHNVKYNLNLQNMC